MSLAEIEAELDKMTPDELRHLALKSWTTFVEKEKGAGASMSVMKRTQSSWPLWTKPLRRPMPDQAGDILEVKSAHG
jgi:hypothetical protein